MENDEVQGNMDEGGSWKEKQDFIVRFINELGTTIDNKAAEFEIPPVVIVGALETLKQEWLMSMMGETLLLANGLRQTEDDDDEDDDETDGMFDNETHDQDP